MFFHSHTNNRKLWIPKEGGSKEGRAEEGWFDLVPYFLQDCFHQHEPRLCREEAIFPGICSELIFEVCALPFSIKPAQHSFQLQNSTQIIKQ